MVNNNSMFKPIFLENIHMQLAYNVFALVTGVVDNNSGFIGRKEYSLIAMPSVSLFSLVYYILGVLLLLLLFSPSSH